MGRCKFVINEIRICVNDFLYLDIRQIKYRYIIIQYTNVASCLLFYQYVYIKRFYLIFGGFSKLVNLVCLHKISKTAGLHFFNGFKVLLLYLWISTQIKKMPIKIKNSFDTTFEKKKFYVNSILLLM